MRFHTILNKAAIGLSIVHRFLRIRNALPESVKVVILVRCDNKSTDGETHLLSKVTGQDIAIIGIITAPPVSHVKVQDVAALEVSHL